MFYEINTLLYYIFCFLHCGYLWHVPVNRFLCLLSFILFLQNIMTVKLWLLLTLLLYMVVSSYATLPCKLRVNLARAEQTDEQGRKCWDTVKVPACGGRCDSREVR